MPWAWSAICRAWSAASGCRFRFQFADAPMVIHRFVTLAAAALAALCPVPCYADSLPSTTGDVAAVEAQSQGSAYQSMMNVLAMMPSESWTSFPVATYADLRAAERAGRATPPSSGAELTAMDRAAFDRWAAAMSRIKVGPFDLSGELGRAQLARSIPDVVSLFQGLPSVCWRRLV